MTTFCLPDLGEGLKEAEILSWHVSPGDRVLADQPLVSVETDKAVVEIPSPQAGVVARIYGELGDVIAVGAKLVDFDTSTKADTGTVVGELPTPAAMAAEPSRKATPAPSAHICAAPAVRALAGKLGVDLRSITGTGPDGAITSRDLEHAAVDAGGARPLRGVRRSMANAMSRSRSEIVPATVQDRADINHWPANVDPTLRLIRSIVAAVAVEPGLNAWYDAEREEVSLRSSIDLGIAMDRPEGLYVPVLHDVASLDEKEQRAEIERLKQGVRERTIARSDLTGQTITLSNFGMIAGRYVSLVIVPPQVAILGAGRIAPEVVADGDEVRICRMLPLSLTFDHRVVTGGEAARFLAGVIANLEDRDIGVEGET